MAARIREQVESRRVIKPRDNNQAPLALAFLDAPSHVTPQSHSPLFNTLLPEIREVIYHYVFEQYEDTRFPYDPSKRWVRPSRSAKLRVAIELLLTCRAVYVESFHMPVACNTLHLFDGAPPDNPTNTQLHTSVYSANLWDALRVKSWQFAAVTRVDLTCQQHMLEGGALERSSLKLGVRGRQKGVIFNGVNAGGYPSTRPYLGTDGAAPTVTVRMPSPGSKITMDRLCVGLPITHLTIRLSRTDWWTWTDAPDTEDIGKQLRLEPLINHTCPPHNNLAMDQGQEARRSDRLPDFNLDAFEAPGRWGVQLSESWPDLQELEMVLETFEPKGRQLDRVVEAAKLWTFPMGEKRVLKWDGEVETIQWQGAPRYGYERQTPWMADAEEDLPTAARRMAGRVRQKIFGSGGEEEEGQRFVVKTLRYGLYKT